MVSGSTTTERVSQVEAKRVWNATVKDSHNFFPKVVPEIFSSVSCLEGDGGVGTIKQFNFNQAGAIIYPHLYHFLFLTFVDIKVAD